MKKKNTKLVSIIMNCYNGEKFLNESLKSIKNQKYKFWELIFFDNASTDSSAKILKNFKDKRIKYFKSKKKLNLGLARLEAYKKCNGELIAFLDVDDLWIDKKLKMQVPYFKDENVGLVICNSLFFNKKKQSELMYLDPPATGYVYGSLVSNYYISLETLVIRKKFIDQLDYSFDPKYDIIHDLDITSRVSKISKLAYVPITLSKWRIHEKGESWKNLKKTNLEKRLFIKKFQDDSQETNKIKKKFLENLNKDEVKFLLLYNRKFDAIKLSLKNFHFSLKSFLIIIYALLPFSNFFSKKLSRFRKLYPNL